MNYFVTALLVIAVDAYPASPTIISTSHLIVKYQIFQIPNVLGAVFQCAKHVTIQHLVKIANLAITI